MYHTIFIYHLLSVLVDVTMGGKFDYYKDVIHFLSKVTFSSVGTAVVFGVQGTGFECSEYKVRDSNLARDVNYH
jgi:hypothetical protein